MSHSVLTAILHISSSQLLGHDTKKWVNHTSGVVYAVGNLIETLDDKTRVVHHSELIFQFSSII